MKNRLGALAIVALLAGCSGQDNDTSGGWQARSMSSADTASNGLAALSQDKARTLGSAPDRGKLFAYEEKAAVRQQGAYRLHPVRLSEEHAIRGVATGLMTVPAPDGSEIKIRYERHEEHPDGNWSWIGRVVGGDAAQEAIFTFGEKAVFGSIPQAVGPALRLTTQAGIAYVMQADASRLKRAHNNAADAKVHVQAAMGSSGSDTALVATALAKARTLAKADVSTKAFNSSNTIDLVIGYTNGFVTANGGAAAAVTHLNNLVVTANQALLNSNINARIRVVRAIQVDYADTILDDDALEQLTGSDGTDPVAVPAALQPLRAARDQYGADLVTLVRDFQQPNINCGLAWLNGSNGSDITVADDAPFGYSVVSDGAYDLGGNTYYCEDIALAHELAHNMGSQHNQADSAGVPGRFPYSYGHKTDVALGNFFTVMAVGDDGQALYRYFSNPDITLCGGRACGVANAADNARSLRQTIPLVTQFRATVVPFPLTTPDLYAVKKMAGSGTEVHAMAGSTNYKSYTMQRTTVLAQTGTDFAWNYQVVDFNGDGALDLVGIKKVGGSGKTELQVLSGATNFKTFLYQQATVLNSTGTDSRWVFRMGHYNNDGKLDLYAINRIGTGGKTDVRVLNGANNFQSYLTNGPTTLAATGTDNAWKFELGDLNNDGKLDIYVIKKVAGSGKTELHVLNGASNFSSYLYQKATLLASTGTDNAWDFKLGDFNRDGKLDLYAIKKMAGSGKTEVHVMNGANQFQSYLINIATILGNTGSDGSWDFVLAG